MLRSRRCSRRSARGQREWEARESIRGSKLSEAAMRAPGEERRDPKKSATARKSSSVLINKNKTTCTHTFVHSTPLKCIITTPPDHQSLDSKKRRKIQHAPETLFPPLSFSVQPGNIPTKHFQLLTTTTSHPNSHTPQHNNCNNSHPPTPQPLTIYHYLLTHSPQIHQLDHTLVNPQTTQAFTSPRRSKG